MAEITVEQFRIHKLWEDFSRTCKFRIPKGYHWPEDNPDDACSYRNSVTKGGVYSNCCFTVCMAWLDRLSEKDRKLVLEEMKRGQRWLEKQERKEGG